VLDVPRLVLGVRALPLDLGFGQLGPLAARQRRADAGGNLGWFVRMPQRAFLV